ncbi:MAG TPA: tetratricopeptide repeat protein [Planctomycetia bacterium]|nr:tetratricopeptide repeat protein [Planctomycetia bacterium]
MLAAHLATVDQRLRRAEHDRAAADVRAAEQRKRRHWQAAAGIAGFLILAIIGAGAWWADRQASEREKDRAVAAERDRHEAAGALTSAEKALSARDLTTAELAMVQAVARVGAGSPPELRSRMESTSRDRDLVRDLREIEDLSWSPGDVSMPDPSEMSRRYDSVFNRYGLNVSESTPESVAESVSKSLVLQSLLAGLGDWFVADPARPRLRQLLDRLDPESNRIAIRSAIASGDEGRVKTLIATIDGSKVPPWFAASVGFHRMVPFEDGSRLMTAAWKANPTEYLLAYRIGLRLWGTSDDRLGEVLAWSRVAVALRPSSPFSHNLLGTAWRGMRNWSEAEASARRAVELGRSYPKYSGAHVGLGNVLLQKGDLEGAEASYRAALAIDPSAGATYFNVGLIYDRKGDLEKAESWYRKAVAAAQTRPFFSEVLADVVRRRAEIDKAKAKAPTRSEKAAGR